MKKTLPYWLTKSNLIRRWKRFFGQIVKHHRDGKITITKPKKLSHSEESAMEIFLSVLRNKRSKLFYDIHTQECYLRSEDAAIYVFLECRNVKIINSVFGYDVNISQHLEGFLLEKFIREMSIRRSAFKTEALLKVNHSLDLTLHRVQQNLKNETKII